MNIDRLESDLNNLIKSGKDYYVRDAAKKRAVEQRVPSYDHFEQIVKGAHLKPLAKNDQIGGQTTQKWNKPANEQTLKTKNQTKHTSPTSFDQTDLLENWKRSDNKLQLLQNTDDESRRVFLSSVLEKHVDFLEELAAEINQNKESEYVISEQAHVDLQTLKNSKRFELAISFFENEDLEELIDQILKN